MPNDHLRPLPGFIVYKNRIVDDCEGKPDLTRDVVAEFHFESDARDRVAKELAADPTADANWIYYEPGTIYD